MRNGAGEQQSRAQFVPVISNAVNQRTRRPHRSTALDSSLSVVLYVKFDSVVGGLQIVGLLRRRCRWPEAPSPSHGVRRKGIVANVTKLDVRGSPAARRPPGDRGSE